MPAEKVQKLMAQAGLGSRRACEQTIRQGRVSVNGQIVRLGERADLQTDEVRVDGVPLRSREPLTYIALHKPPGVLSSSQSQGGHPTVIELVGSERRLYPVGRLDLESEGLMLLTNDGELAYRLTHPRFEHEKEYRVRLDRRPTQDELRRWREGMALADGQPALPCRVDLEPPKGEQVWIQVILTQGRKRQIRETAEVLGLRVQRLIRTRLAGLPLGQLPIGRWRELEPSEAARLRRAAGLDRGNHPRVTRPSAHEGG